METDNSIIYRLEELECKWCGEFIAVSVPQLDYIHCPRCKGKLEVWGDGDIDFDSYYLTRVE